MGLCRKSTLHTSRRWSGRVYARLLPRSILQLFGERYRCLQAAVRVIGNTRVPWAMNESKKPLIVSSNIVINYKGSGLGYGVDKGFTRNLAGLQRNPCFVFSLTCSTGPRTFIKGHQKAIEEENGFLSRENYRKLVHGKMNWATSKYQDSESKLERQVEHWHLSYSQQQNALGYNLSMQGIGDAAIDRPRFDFFLRSRKDFFEVSQGGSRKGSRKDSAVGLHSWVNFTSWRMPRSAGTTGAAG